jgi:hypothetical protein
VSTDLSEPLSERDFRPVECDLPGDWASNVRWTIQLVGERDIKGRKRTVARVYDAPIDALELPRVEQLTASVSEDNVEATRLALEGAEEESGVVGGAE